jgi:hypothetical protein
MVVVRLELQDFGLLDEYPLRHLTLAVLNENNRLKSTNEMQNNLGSYQHQSSVPPFTTTCTQDSNLINTQNAITSIESKIKDQRFRMLEFQMMQNMTMNNMISNQQMQIMMQQQQMTQQSYAHPNYGQSMYPTIPMWRVILPPTGFLQNTMPPNYPYNWGCIETWLLSVLSCKILDS